MPRRILLADDSVTAQNMGKKILSDAGYEVITVSNGSAALKKVNELLPDICVLDVYMPGYSGLEVCKQLKENTQTAEIPVLLTVGKLEPFKSEEALKAKANAFIIKPFEATELLAVIRKIEDATSKKEKKAVKAPKASALSRVFSPATPVEAPETQDTSIEAKGWKNRLSMPGKKKPEAEPEEEETAAVGTGFRDLTEPATDDATLRRESSFTADTNEVNAPVGSSAAAEPPLDISPEEIAAIKAAVEVLSGEGDRAPVLNVAAVDGMPRHLAPEPEETPEAIAAEDARLADKLKATAAPEPTAAEAAVSEVPVVEEQLPAVEQAATAAQVAETIEPVVAQAALESKRWVAEVVELSPSEAALSLEKQMQEAQDSANSTTNSITSNPITSTESFNTYSLADFAESTQAEPVDDEPILAEAAAAELKMEPVAETAAMAASASADGHASAISAPASEVQARAEAPAGYQEMQPVASVAVAPAMSPSVSYVDSNGGSRAMPRDPSAPDDEIDSRTKSQMDAAWTNWREIRNTIVTPALTEQLADVAVAVSEVSTQGGNAEAVAHDPASIASIVDSVLAEMRPKLVEEIARKLAAKKE